LRSLLRRPLPKLPTMLARSFHSALSFGVT
jgi:hypothetical protein